MKVQKDIGEWHRKKFPEADHIDILRKLCEEVGELGEAIARKDASSIRLELGDVGVCICGLAEKIGCSTEDLIEKAHIKNLNRETKGVDNVGINELTKENK